MNTVKFGDYNSWEDFSLILNSKEITSPTPKTASVDIPGGDGVIDLSEYFGEVKYNNRKITLVFSTSVPQIEFLDLFSEIQNALHGQKLQITLSEDPDFYYVGRITLDKWKADKNIGRITIDCDCEPYKYNRYETIRVETITTSETLIFQNLRKSVVPVFRLTAPATLAFKNTTVSVTSINTDFTSPSIVFTAGNNLLTVTGATTISVRYQERGL